MWGGKEFHILGAEIRKHENQMKVSGDLLSGKTGRTLVINAYVASCRLKYILTTIFVDKSPGLQEDDSR